MSDYKLTRYNTILRTADGASIPITPKVFGPPGPDGQPGAPVPQNSDYLEYLAWVAAGNTPDPADPAPLIFQTQEALLNTGQTNTTTPLELFRGLLSTNTGYIARLTVLGVDLGNGAMKEQSARFVVKRLTAAAIQVGSPVVDAPIQDAAASGWVLAAGVSGNSFIVTVTGAAGRTIAWTFTGTYISFTPAGR